MATKSAKQLNKKASTLARQEDGTVQLTIAIPQNMVQGKREEALGHLMENLEVPGFRKGKVTRDVALKHIDQQKLYEHMLQHLLPEVYAKAIEEHALKPVLAPRFELLSVEEGRDWSVRAITCELPNIDLGDYKKEIMSAQRAQDIWVPGKGEDKEKGPTREQKEQQVIRALVEKFDIQIPQPLIDEEVNHRLSGLLDQLQKLGLTVEQYLGSRGKTNEQLKREYAEQAKASIKLELALNKIAEQEKILVSDGEIEEAIKASSRASGEEKPDTLDPRQKALIKSALLRRKTLDSLVALL